MSANHRLYPSNTNPAKPEFPIGMKLKSYFTREKGKEYKEVFKQGGLKGLITQYGWKLVVAVFLYYLIRDSILYILIPYLIAKGLFSG